MLCGLAPIVLIVSDAHKAPAFIQFSIETWLLYEYRNPAAKLSPAPVVSITLTG